MSTTTSDLETIVPRAVTDEEAAHYRKHGWVKLDSLVSESQAAVLLEHMQRKMGVDATSAQHNSEYQAGGKLEYWNIYAPLSIDLATGRSTEDLLYNFSHCKEIGAIGSRLVGDRIRYSYDEGIVKMPAGKQGSAPTDWHTDMLPTGSQFDPPDAHAMIWIALGDIPPERGSLRFVSASDADEEVSHILTELPFDETYPLLEARGVLSPANHLHPGDATVHSSRTWHSAPANKTDELRWGYVVSFFRADARYSGHAHWSHEGVEGLVAGETFVDYRFPVL